MNRPRAAVSKRTVTSKIVLAGATPPLPPTNRDIEKEIKKDLVSDTEKLLDNHAAPKQKQNQPIQDSSRSKAKEVQLIKQAVTTQMDQPMITPLDQKTKDETKKAAAKDALKESLKNLQMSQEKLKNLMEKNERVLCQISTVFPFTLFPTKVIVRENKVEVIFSNFFASKTIRSADIKDISEIVINTSWFFSSMKIVAKTFVDNEITVSFLKNDDALKVRRLVEGLTSMAEEKIDVSKLSTDNLIDRSEKLGSAALQ